MGRPPIPLGHAGAVTVTEVREKIFRARCRYRDELGRMYWIERQAASRSAARNAVLAEITRRRGVHVSDLRDQQARFALAVDLYDRELDNLVADGHIRVTTAERYRLCLPRIKDGLGELRIAELTTGRVALFMSRLHRTEKLSADTRRLHRAVLSGILKMLAENDIVTGDLMAGLRQIRGDDRAPRALTPDERRRVLAWCDTDARARARGMGDLVRLMLGTGARIGEALAIRWCDVDLVGVPVQAGDAIVQVPVLAITGNVVDVKGCGVVRHPGKTKAARRVVPLPVFVVDVLRARRPVDARPEWPVFAAHLRTGEIGWKRRALVQGWFREMRDAVDMPWLTSHVLRKTAATILHDAGLPDRQIGGITGHSDLSTLLNVYIGRGELHPQAAAALDAAYGDGGPVGL